VKSNLENNSVEPTPKPETLIETPTETTPVTTDTVAQPSVPSDAPTEAAPAPIKPSHKKMVTLLVIILLILCIPAAAYAGYTKSKQKSDKTTTTLNTTIASLQANVHDLPIGTIKISDCVPNMGFHYATKTSDKEYCPFLLVNTKGKVIGTEYMAAKEMYTAIPKTDPLVEVITKDSPMYGWKYDHAKVSHLPKGHEGLLRDPLDIHLYTVSLEEQKNSCVKA
jgi:hypothetical protein